MKKGCLIAAGGGVVLIGAIVALVFLLTGGAADAAGKFLTQIGEGKSAEAYQSTAAAFQSQQSLAEFTTVVEKLGLNHFQSASWNNRSIDTEQTTLEGTATTKEGTGIPLVLKLVKEGGTWKVRSLTSTKAGASIAPALELPAEDELKRMATESVLDLDEAVQLKDFRGFRAKTAVLWQKQATAEQLQRSFQAFIDKEIHMGGVKDVMPEFDTPPAINSDEVLVLTGHYPTRPSQVQFTVKYLKEGQSWKLVGINVKLS